MGSKKRKAGFFQKLCLINYELSRILGIGLSFRLRTCPFVTGGQLLTGIDGKNAIGITSLAEGLTCVVGVIAYMIVKDMIDWTLAPYLMIGAICSVPLSALTVRNIKIKKLRVIIGVVTLVLGVLTLGKTLL